MAFRKLDKGDRVADYLLVERIGVGGFGEVWKAEHVQTAGKFVAVKIPTNPESMDLLKREALFQHELDHPRIVKTFHHDTQHNPPYFVMEYVEGKNLRQMMLDDGILPPPYAIDIAVQILDALDYSHGKNFVHKDIKPENILVEKRRVTVSNKGQALLHYVKITDLGLGFLPGRPEAEILVSEEARTTGVRLLSGTLFYMAPEQMVPKRQVDPRADIYSLGVVLYEMLTGELPLGMDLPSELNPVVPCELDRICKRALSIDRDSRYATAREMMGELQKAKENFLSQRSASGKPGLETGPAMESKGLTPRTVPLVDLPAAPTPKRSRPRALEWAILAVVFLFLGLGLWLSILIYRRAGRGEGGEKPKSFPSLSNRLNGPLVITSDPPGALVQINGTKVGRTPYEKSDPPYARTEILLSREFYQSRLIVLEPRPRNGRMRFAIMEGSSDPEQILDASAGLTLERVKLRPAKGELRVQTPNVPRVAVRIDGDLYGRTPFSMRVTAGYRTLRLEKEGFEPHEEKIRIEPDATAIYKIPLLPRGTRPDLTPGRFARVSIESTPANARVVINREERGRTPLSLDLPPGEYTLEVSTLYHEPRRQKLLVSSTAPRHHYFTLSRFRSKVEFTSTPPGAIVLLDGRRIGTTPLTDVLDGGKHEITFRANGFRSVRRTLEVSGPGPIGPIEVALERIPPGILRVDSDLPGLEIYVNGVSAGRLPLRGFSLAAGSARLRVLDVIRAVQVAPGRETRVRFSGPDLGLIHIPSGKFTYGTTHPRPGQLQARSVTLPSYHIDRTEVTNAKYAEFLADILRTGDHKRWCHPDEGKEKDHTPRTWSDARFNGAQQPVVGVDYWDAYAYARWAGKRLPTEKEWEKAARGEAAFKYPWGDQWDPTRLNWADFSLKEDPYRYTSPVGSFPQGGSPYGCLDMAGNASEWCADNYEEGSLDKVVRGGSFRDQDFTITFSRWSQSMNTRSETLGFRCVLGTTK